MSKNLTPEELARLRLKARHGSLSPEEQALFAAYVEAQSSAPPPSEPKPESKPKRTLDLHKISEIVPKIIGVALIVVTLVAFGPALVRTGGAFVNTMFQLGTAANTHMAAKQSGISHYVREDHEAGTVDYERWDYFIDGEYFVYIHSDAHYGIEIINAGAYDAGSGSDGKPSTVSRGAFGVGVIEDDSRIGITRIDAFREWCSTHGLNADELVSAEGAFDWTEAQLSEAVEKVATSITYGEIVQHSPENCWGVGLIDDAYPSGQFDLGDFAWSVTSSPLSQDNILFDKYHLDSSMGTSQMFVDAQPISNK